MLYHLSMIESELLKMLASETLTHRTKENYLYYCMEFWSFYFKDKSEDAANAEEVEPIDVHTWLASRPDWSQSTKYSAVAALRKFYRWKWGEDHPVVRIKIKKTDPGPQRTLDQGELMQVMAGIDTTTEIGIRNLAILSLMTDTGIRASEICNLEISRLDLRRQRLTLLVKGGGMAEKLFFDYTTVCLESWLAIRPTFAMPNVKTVFVSVGGRTPGKKMTVSGLRYFLESIAERTGTRHFSPHAMRRTFATLATENGAPSRVVQVAGGWKSIRMVERYTQMLNHEAIKPYSPVDRLMNG